MNPERAAELDALDVRRVDSLRAALAPEGYTFWGHVGTPFDQNGGSEGSQAILRQLRIKYEVRIVHVAYDSQGKILNHMVAIYLKPKSPKP